MPGRNGKLQLSRLGMPNSWKCTSKDQPHLLVEGKSFHVAMSISQAGRASVLAFLLMRQQSRHLQRGSSKSEKWSQHPMSLLPKCWSLELAPAQDSIFSSVLMLDLRTVPLPETISDTRVLAIYVATIILLLQLAHRRCIDACCPIGQGGQN